MCGLQAFWPPKFFLAEKIPCGRFHQRFKKLCARGRSIWFKFGIRVGDYEILREPENQLNIVICFRHMIF